MNKKLSALEVATIAAAGSLAAALLLGLIGGSGEVGSVASGEEGCAGEEGCENEGADDGVCVFHGVVLVFVGWCECVQVEKGDKKEAEKGDGSKKAEGG